MESISEREPVVYKHCISDLDNVKIIDHSEDFSLEYLFFLQYTDKSTS